MTLSTRVLKLSTNVLILSRGLRPRISSMAKRASLSKGEMDVAKTIWTLSEASIGQIFDELTKSKKVDYSTVQTYVRRLEAKGYLKVRRIGRNKLYSAKVRPGAVIGQAFDDMMNQLFDGELIPMVKHLINDRGISESEMQQLRDILNEAEEEDDDEH